MKKQPRRSSFITRVQNSQFRRLFFKNWLLVILCVILPLLVCSLISQYVSRKNLMQELDTSSQRSVRNTKATLQSLLDEAMDTLEIQSRDLSILTFLQQPRFSPSDYDFVIEAGDILSRISRDERRSLYDSVDAYSQFSNYLVSTLYRVQAYERIPDQSLVDTFSVYQEEHPRQTLFAQTRTSSYLGQQKHLITLYRIVAVAEQQKAFVSLSIDTDKLGQYLADELFPDQSAYLIVDASNRVILDTTHRLVGESLVLPTANQLVSSMNGKIGDENVRIAWTDVGEFGWQFVQLIPLSEFEATMRFEQNTINLVLLFSVLLSMLLSYLTTKKLFRPVEAILSILENPSNQQITDANGEIPDIPVTPGTYTFREILAPSGYALNEAETRFTVDEQGNVTGNTMLRDNYTRVQLRNIPLKTVGFVYDREKQEWKAVEGVNVTLGLPIIRASVDHGTDFYHAGKGNGNELSLVNAIKYAVKMTGRAN